MRIINSYFILRKQRYPFIAPVFIACVAKKLLCIMYIYCAQSTTSLHQSVNVLTKANANKAHAIKAHASKPHISKRTYQSVHLLYYTPVYLVDSAYSVPEANTLNPLHVCTCMLVIYWDVYIGKVAVSRRAISFGFGLVNINLN